MKSKHCLSANLFLPLCIESKGSIALPFILSIGILLLPFLFFSDLTLSTISKTMHAQSVSLRLESNLQTKLFQKLETDSLDNFNDNEADVVSVRSDLSLDGIKTSKTFFIRTSPHDFRNIPWKDILSNHGNHTFTIGERESDSHKLSQFTCKYSEITLADNIQCAGNLKITKLLAINSEKETSIIATGDCVIDALELSQQANLVIICNGTIDIKYVSLETTSVNLTVISNATLNIIEIKQAKNGLQDTQLSLHAKKGITLRSKEIGRHLSHANTSPLNNWPSLSLVGIL